MGPSPLKVLLVDDHAMARAGIRLMLESADDIRVVAEARTIEEALSAVDAYAIDVALLDISIGNECGLNLLRVLRRKQPGLAMLMLSTHAETSYGVRALKGGAVGYLTKDVGIADLVGAVRKASVGGMYISSALGERLVRQINGSSQAAHCALSEREFDVMRRLAAGETLTSIAHALFLSPKTVSTHRSRIFVKLGVRSNAELARYALEEQLI